LRAIFVPPVLVLMPLWIPRSILSKIRRISPRRQEANRARREAEEGPLSQTKRQWPGAVAPAASEPAAGGANDEEAEVEEGEVKAADKEEEAEGADRAPAQAEPEAEAGANGAKAPKKARKERRQGQVREPRAVVQHAA
jgi:hypothetical protein